MRRRRAGARKRSSARRADGICTANGYNTSTDYGATWSQGSGGAFVNTCGGASGCPDNQSRPTIAVDTGGDMYVFAWGVLDNTPNIVWSTNAGGSFSSWAAVDEQSGGSAN